MSVATATLYFAMAVLCGAGAGLVVVAICYRPFRYGPTARIAHLLQAGSLLLMLGYAWAAALNLERDMAGQPWEVTYGIATGGTVAGGWLFLRRRRRYRRSLSAAAAPGNEVPAGPPSARPTQNRARHLVRLAIRCADYVMGALFCSLALTGGAALSSYLRGEAARWFTGNGHLPGLIGTYVLLAASGFCYAQLISGAAFRAMNTALVHDWRVSRNWHYVLLAPPFLWSLPLSIAAPGMLIGILSHLATLWVGWRFTSEPPGTTLQTLRRLRQRTATRREPTTRPKTASRANGAAQAKAAGAAAERHPDIKSLDGLRGEFLALHLAAGDLRERGRELQRLLSELFTLAGLTLDQPFTLRGDQVDGSFRHNGVRYVMAARWPSAAQRTGLDAFERTPLDGRQDSVRLFVNVNGFTSSTQRAYSASAPVIAMDGSHLFAVLERRIGLGDLLDRLKHQADQTGHPYLPISRALAG